MKKLIATICMVAACVCASMAQTQPATPVDSASMSEITFESTVHDFGKMTYAGDGTTKFTFKNTGNGPLVLNNVQSSCGCTIPEWPREVVEPGASKSITVTYNTRRTGVFTKTVTVYSNAKNGTIYLTIKGEVGPEPKTETAPAPASGK